MYIFDKKGFREKKTLSANERQTRKQKLKEKTLNCLFAESQL
jgi:hypothetical protein